jgi:GMP synthase (glutamine-hydrolysing)
MTELQAFRHGATAWGVLFHLEVTEQMVQEMVATFAVELATAGLEPATVLRDLAARIASLEIIAAGVFDSWTDVVRGSGDRR